MNLTFRFFCGLLVAAYFAPASGQAEEKDVISIVNEEAAPYYGEFLPGYGVYAQVVEAAFNASGYKVRFHTDNWSRAMRDTERYQYDAIAAAWPTENRALRFHYSTPYSENRMMIFKRADNPVTKINLDSPQSVRIGLVRDSWIANVIGKNRQLDTLFVADDLTVARLVLRGRVDFGALEEVATKSFFSEHFPQEYKSFEILPEPAAINPTTIMISKNHPNATVLLDAFNAGLETIIRNGKYREIFEAGNIAETMIAGTRRTP